MTAGNQSAFSYVLWAIFGAAIVLIGLFVELFAEREKFNSIRSFRRWKIAKKWGGEIVVIIGIVVEMIVGGIYAFREWKNDPLKQPIANASATVRFLVKIKSYDSPYFPTEPDDIVGWKSQIMFFNGTNLTGSVLQLTAFQNDAIVFNRGWPPQRQYQLQFRTDPLIDFSNTGGNKNPPAEILNDVASFIMAIPQLETNAEILSGSVVLVANDKTWTFDIPPQRQKWGVITSERIINANNKTETKVMPIQIGDWAIPPRWTNRWYDGK